MLPELSVGVSNVPFSQDLILAKSLVSFWWRTALFRAELYRIAFSVARAADGVNANDLLSLYHKWVIYG